MTLKEKFVTMVLDTDIAKWEYECEKIADDYAIEFAEWIAKEYWLNSSGKYSQSQNHKELLEIFKKEKGL
jgi:hypothetical protein